MGRLVWKVLSTAAPIAAALVATKAADAVWRTIGNDKVDPKDPDASTRQAIGYAALTGLAVGAARTWATRRATAYYTASAGHPPKALERG